MKALLAVLALMFALFVAAGVAAFWFFSGDIHSETRELTVPHVVGSSLAVTTRNGAISVERSDVQEIEIVATIKAMSEERLAKSEIVTQREGETLRISVAWPEGKRKMREGCSFELRVPEGVKGVALTASNGSLTSSGLAGDASLESSNGSIKISNHDGKVDLDTSNGRIQVVGVTGSVDAKSSNGSLDIALADGASGSVVLKTSNGSVNLKLGSEFSGRLKMKTSNGSISYGGAAGAKVLKGGRKSAEIQFGESNEASSIETSNGSITVRK